MKIKLAKDVGFCWGVRRALNLALKSSSRTAKVYTYGPLIHNVNVVEMLKTKGIEPFPGRKPKSKGKVLLLIRAHGVAPSVQKKLTSKNLRVIDATCPHVKKSQKLVQEYAKRDYQIIIAGDKKHAEVISLIGYARDIQPKSSVLVISSTQEASKLINGHRRLLKKKICMLAQSTFQPGLFHKIVETIKHKVAPTSKITVLNTICHAPARRQDEVKNLANKVDAIIVVGDYKSANTSNLTLLARSLKIPTFQVASASELPIKKLTKYSSIGIATGTSTPDSDIQAVVDKIAQL